MYTSCPKMFERNRYFYGKLLTAQDFIAEQTYFMNKRRMINRMLFGSGVVCGLEVVKSDEVSIAVESGVALDSAGNEIVVAQPITKKLSSIEGFDALRNESDDSLQSAYLCIEYVEKESEPIYSIAPDMLEDAGGPEHNKMTEGYTLRITSAEPPVYPPSARSAAFLENVIWNDGAIRITQAVPRFVNADSEFYMETRIMKGACRRRVSLSFRIDMQFLSVDGRHCADIEFEEPDTGEHEVYSILTRIRAHSLPQKADIRVSGVTVIIDSRHESGYDQQMKVYISSDAQNALIESQRNISLQNQWEQRPILYLARLQLIVSPMLYSIEHIENNPFSQVVLNAVQTASLFEMSHSAPEPEKSAEISQPLPTTEETAKMGTVTVSLPAGAKKDGLYMSNPVAHGLGPGTVFITAGFVSGGHVLTDGGNVFDSPFSWGVKLIKEDGTFIIGVRLREDMPSENLNFCWRAERGTETLAVQEETLMLTPGVYYAVRKETVRLEATLSSGRRLKKGELQFSVRPENGGRIDEAGVFTSFDNPGIFEITASSLADPKLRASAFVVVK